MKEEKRFNQYRWIIGLTLAAEYPLGSQMKISDEETVTIAGAGEFCIGTLYALPEKGLPGKAGICVDGHFNHRGTGIASGVIAAGDRLKVGTPDGTTQRYAKFIPGTDDPGIVRGAALTAAAAANDEFEAIFY
jgi:hypothetical protein